MPINITMPALSPTTEEGNLARWLKKVCDAVRVASDTSCLNAKAPPERGFLTPGQVCDPPTPAASRGWT
jgi:hypothetical protein